MIEEKQAKKLGAQIKALRLSRNESQLEFGKNFFHQLLKVSFHAGKAVNLFHHQNALLKLRK